MNYISIYFYLFVGILLVVYYILPKRYRWFVLLAGSMVFYYRLSEKGFKMFVVTILLSYSMGYLLDYMHNTGKSVIKCRIALAGCLAIIALPLIVTKEGDFVLQSLLHGRTYSWIVPVGLSFYTLQIVSYLVDVSRGKVRAQKNLGKYALFVSFFPQIIQGPIPRYEQMNPQLFEGHSFKEESFLKGVQMIVWGFFLKLMIADKASIVVNTIFLGWEAYRGGYVLVAGILYSIQLYADFLSCLCLAKGVAELFDIHLGENFQQPYMSRSIKEFWGRWHISLSSWLKDYIYIPLGGNRKGRWRKYIHLIITFSISGMWHGAGYKYIFWGLMHAFYQVCGELTRNSRDKIFCWLGIGTEGRIREYIRCISTCFFVMLAWVIFRAGSLRIGLSMLYSMVTVYNPWIFFDDSLLTLGLSWKEWGVLLVSVWLLYKVEHIQRVCCVREKILRQPRVIRWGIYLGAVAVIMIFGTYGYGFDASDFIYGGF